MAYVIQEGKSIVTKGGILEPGTEVTKDDLGHKDDNGLKSLEKKGVLGKKPGPASKKKPDDDK